MSRSRLTEVENGGGTFTAEQFLEILRLFNVTVDHFLPPTTDKDRLTDLQNSLARLGATHLVESDDKVPSASRSVDTVIAETLTTGHPRLIAALAPVIVRNVERIALSPPYKLDVLGRRVVWLFDNVRAALSTQLAKGPSRETRRLYRRAELVLGRFLEHTERKAEGVDLLEDVLDAAIRSRRTLDDVRQAASPISRRWAIVSGLHPKDFEAVLAETFT